MSASSSGLRGLARGAIVAIVAVVATAGCGGNGDSNEAGPTASAPHLTHPVGADVAIVRISAGGGLAPAAVRVSDTLPIVWVSGDGRHLSARASAMETPALARLAERRLSEAGIQQLLESASAAGLLEPAPDYGTPRIFDAVNTRVLVVADGKRHDVLALALGYPVTDLDPKTVAARRRLERFIGLAEQPRRLGATGPPREYEPEALAVFVLGPAEPARAADPATWPLGDLATIGTPTGWPTPDTRCVIVSGADLAAVTAVARRAPVSAPWRSGGTRYDVALRPLMPDEHTCADVTNPPKI